MHIVVAIPTYNRCSYLKTNIEYFKKQVVSEGVRLSIAISNSASTDGTSDYLSEISSIMDDLSTYNELRDWNGYNYGCLLETIPDDADWVWLMGDDDYLTNPRSVDIVCDLIKSQKENKNFALVHACQGRRSNNSGDIFIENVMDLCNEIGYLELLGWISSLVIRKDVFVEAFTKTYERGLQAKDEPGDANTHSAFYQASYLLESLYDKTAGLIDLPLVEPQDENQTSESKERWLSENMGERYIYVVDDLERLVKVGLPLQRLNEKFFRYHTFHLWDRFMAYQAGLLGDLSRSEDKKAAIAKLSRYAENWERIAKITEFLEDGVLKKSLVLIINGNANLCELYLNKNFDMDVGLLLQKQAQLLAFPTYSMKLLPEVDVSHKAA